MTLPRVIVFGSRTWNDPKMICKALEFALAELGTFQLVHGQCCTGADSFADLWALSAPVPLPERHPAKWRLPDGSLDTSAGPRRNAEMVRLGARLAIGFRAPGKSNGTDGMCDLVIGAGVPLALFWYDGSLQCV